MAKLIRKKTHILIECPEKIPSVQVGVIAPLAPQDGKLYDTRFVCTRNIKKKDVAWADIFICVRGCYVVTHQIVCEAKRLRRFVIYYLDDDLLDVPKDSAVYEFFSKSERIKALKEIIGLSDVLWGVNDNIREKYLPFCPSRRWVWNRVPMNTIPVEAPSTDAKVHFLYAGSVDHSRMVQEVLSPAVRKVCAEREGNVDFTFLGADPGIPDLPQVSFRRFFENYGDYRNFVENGHFSVGLAVVRLDSFYQCKYYNKFVEYASIGAAGIFTDCPLYRQVVQSEENGLLCENTTQAWVDAMERMIDDAPLRQRCISAAQDLLRREFQPADVCSSMLEQIPELREYRAPVVSAFSVRIGNLWLSFCKERAMALLEAKGIKAIPVIAFKALRMAVKYVRKVFQNVFRVLQRDNQ